MKFIISKTALEMAVKNICRVINPKNALPILTDILCMVDEERKTITMTGSDSEAWLTYQLQLQECEGGGPVCIGADLLRDALVALKGPLGNTPAFRKAIESVLADDDARERVLGELGLAAQQPLDA